MTGINEHIKIPFSPDIVSDKSYSSNREINTSVCTVISVQL